MDYDLPLKELELELELDEKAKYPVREIRTKLTKKLEQYVAIIQGVVHPDGADASSLQEYPTFSELEREEVRSLFSLLMKYLRWADYSSVSLEESDEIAFIKGVWQDWPELKKRVLHVIKKQRLGWEEASLQEQPQGYLG